MLKTSSYNWFLSRIQISIRSKTYSTLPERHRKSKQIDLHGNFWTILRQTESTTNTDVKYDKQFCQTINQIIKNISKQSRVTIKVNRQRTKQQYFTFDFFLFFFLSTSTLSVTRYKQSGVSKERSKEFFKNTNSCFGQTIIFSFC